MFQTVLISVPKLATFCYFLPIARRQYYILMSGFAGHIYHRFAIAHQEKIATLLGVNGYNSRNRKQAGKYRTANFGTLS